MKQNCASKRCGKNDQNVTEQILELEHNMFQNVPTTHRYHCQEDAQSFQLHRRAQFAAWSLPTLESYLQDLKEAQDAERNLMAIKYARMDNLVPCENFSPRIDTIVTTVLAGQKQFIEKYPRLMQGGRPVDKDQDSSDMTSFETYLRSELETYSETTLGLLMADMMMLQNEGSNLSEVTYSYLAKQWGYDSIDDLEKSL